jgi:hypothetical protein
VPKEIFFPNRGMSVVKVCPAVSEITTVSCGSGARTSHVAADQLAELPVQVVVVAVVIVNVLESPSVLLLPPQSPINLVPPFVRSRAPASERAKVMSLKSQLPTDIVAPVQVMVRGVPSVADVMYLRLVAEIPVSVKVVVTVSEPDAPNVRTPV